MTKQLDTILGGLDDLKARLRSDDAGEMAPTVAYLKGALNAVTQPEDRSLLITLLAIELGDCGQLDEEESLRREAIKAFPDDVGQSIGLAMFLLLNGKTEEALNEANRAVEISKRTGKFNRHALQTVARCLKKKGDYSGLASTLRELIALKPGSPDAKVERDFLVGLPANAIPADLVDAYQKRT